MDRSAIVVGAGIGDLAAAVGPDRLAGHRPRADAIAGRLPARISFRAMAAPADWHPPRLPDRTTNAN